MGKCHPCGKGFFLIPWAILADPTPLFRADKPSAFCEFFFFSSFVTTGPCRPPLVALPCFRFFFPPCSRSCPHCSLFSPQRTAVLRQRRWEMISVFDPAPHCGSFLPPNPQGKGCRLCPFRWVTPLRSVPALPRDFVPPFASRPRLGRKRQQSLPGL